MPALRVGLLLAIVVSVARADPPVSIGAELSSTILEVRIERGSLVLIVEVGARDADAFVDLLAGAWDEVDPLEGKDRAWHLERFFDRGVVIRRDDGTVLAGEVRLCERRPRRDRPARFQPTPYQLARSGEVVYAEIVYPLGEEIASLELRPPLDDGGRPQADVGFIAFHEGIQIIDFRFLSASEKLVLDWRDPWYSRFENRNLTRHHRDPAMSFIYVEPTQVRHEILIRPRDLGTWLDLGLEANPVIEVGEQEEIKRRVGDLLSKKNPVRIDGEPANLALDRIHFLRMGLNGFEVIDPPEPISNSAALLGVIFSCEVLDWPQQVTVTWELWDERITKVPAMCVDEAGPFPGAMDPEDPVSKWQNFLTNPSRPGLIEVGRPPPPVRWYLPTISLALAALLVVLGIGRLWSRERPGRRDLLVAGAFLVAIVLAWPLARVEIPELLARRNTVSEADARRALSGLLRNVYRSYDFHGEEKVYDALARSVAGDLLGDIYLETRRSLELRNQGGAQVKVQTVEVTEARPRPLEDTEGFEARATWLVSGSVGHWGHVHQRKNRYDARLRVEPLEGRWKITELDLLDEERVQ